LICIWNLLLAGSPRRVCLTFFRGRRHIGRRYGLIYGIDRKEKRHVFEKGADQNDKYCLKRWFKKLVIVRPRKSVSNDVDPSESAEPTRHAASSMPIGSYCLPIGTDRIRARASFPSFSAAFFSLPSCHVSAFPNIACD
jgi:hypothetical protein